MSANAFASDWVTLERHTILFRDPTNAQRRFIPLRLDDTDIKDTLKQFLYIDWRHASNEEYAKLLAACRPQTTVATPARLQVRDPTALLQGHHRSITAVKISPEGKWAASSSGDNTVRIWDIESRICAFPLKGTGGALAVSRDRKYLCTVFGGTIRVWNLQTGDQMKTLRGHHDIVTSLTPIGQTPFLLSGSADRTVRLWNLDEGQCIIVFQGHTDVVRDVAASFESRTAVSASDDTTLRVWDFSTGRSLAVLEGHTRPVKAVAVTADGRRAISGAEDRTVRIWNLSENKCLGVLEGHTQAVSCVAITPDGRRAVSGSYDQSILVWDLATGRSNAVLVGNEGPVYDVAISDDGSRMISGGYGSGTLYVWDLYIDKKDAISDDTTRYTNAKVVLVGKSGAGKTGLAIRLSEHRWEPTESSHGMRVTKLQLTADNRNDGMEREVWLWDLAGQPDYRLVHQLYMDETALGLLVFDPQDDNPFENLAYWEKALRSANLNAQKLLVAARCDRGGITVSQKLFHQFCQQHEIPLFLPTAAKTGEGCEELEAAITAQIPWERLPWTATTRLFKTLKDAILKLKEDGSALVRLTEMLQRLQLMLPNETIDGSTLRAVVGLMQGQGIVSVLQFGDFILLQPEQINRYASVVVRMAREHADEMGVVPEQQVLDGRLDFKDIERIPANEETILLRAMVQTFLERALCLREYTPAGTMLVFPSYFRRDKPDLPEHPNVFVTYGFAGPLDEIYSSLVVRLSYSDVFERDQLWKNAADFKTPGGKRVGLFMKPTKESAAEMTVYFEKGVPDDSKVTFIKYVHEHLVQRAQDLTRVRTYVCPHCDSPLENRKAIQDRIARGLIDILCADCENRVPLFDLIENKFASDEFLYKVQELDRQARINLDNESRELILIGHAFAVSGEAGQIFRPTANSDWGIDGEIEFKNNFGHASGKRVYLQLKSGDSYLYTRKSDGKEIFTIKNPRHISYWQAHEYSVMLVIRTSDGQIRWMNVSQYLRKHGVAVKQIIFEGEPFTALNVVRMRDKLLGGQVLGVSRAKS